MRVVVIGGGIINGISQLNVWPQKRMSEIIAEDRILNRGWNATLKQSFAIADNEKIAAGTRYDALRIVVLADTNEAIKALSKYLGKLKEAEGCADSPVCTSFEMIELREGRSKTSTQV